MINIRFNANFKVEQDLSTKTEQQKKDKTYSKSKI